MEERLPNVTMVQQNMLHHAWRKGVTSGIDQFLSWLYRLRKTRTLLVKSSTSIGSASGLDIWAMFSGLVDSISTPRWW